MTHLDENSARDKAPRAVGLSIRHNFAWTLAGNVVFAGSQWAIAVLLAKLGSAEIVGQFALAVAVAYPITLIANLQLRVLYVTDHDGKYSFEEMLGLRLILSGLAILVILMTCGIVGYTGPTTRLIVVVGIAQLADCISENYYGISQRYERMDRIARSLMVRSLLSFVTLAFVVYYSRRLIWGFVGVAFCRMLVLLLYDASRRTFELAAGDSRHHWASAPHERLHERLRPRWNFRSQLQMVWIALPLAIAGILVSTNGYLPRYFLESALGQHQLGIYAAINYIPAGCFMATIALAYAVFPRLSKLFASGDLAGFRLLLMKTAGIYGAWGLAVFLLSVIGGRQVLTIVYRPEYAEHVELLRWLMIAGIVQCLSTAMQAGLTAACQFRIQVPLFAGVIAVSLIACIVLVPRLGLTGAAVAVLISSVIQLCASTSLVFRTMFKRARELKAMDSPQLQPALEVPVNP